MIQLNYIKSAVRNFLRYGVFNPEEVYCQLGGEVITNNSLIETINGVTYCGTSDCMSNNEDKLRKILKKCWRTKTYLTKQFQKAIAKGKIIEYGPLEESVS